MKYEKTILGYGHAPYNFITFPEKIVYRDGELPTHDKFDENL